jgi:hypothetical protein
MKLQKDLFETSSHYVFAVKNACERKHYFYDVETEIINGKHDPILVIMQNCQGAENLFYGKNCIEKFCEEIFSKKYQKSIFISHGGRNYDHYFPLKYCYTNNILPKVIFNGSQILKLEIEKYNIVFKDNLNFLSRPLSDLPKTMGLDISISKGFFPYNLPFPFTDRLIIDLPPKKDFLADTMTVERKKEFDIWYDDRLKNNSKFDYYVELSSYCSQDVRILRLAAIKFRNLIIDMGSVDPYEDCLTLAHVCSEIYKRKFLRSETIAIIPHFGFKSKKNFSIKSIKYFEYLMHINPGLLIQHEMNGGEIQVLGKYFIDGFQSISDSSKKGIIHEFAG